MSDVRTERLDEILTLIRAYGTKYRHKLKYLEVELDDYVQDVIGNIFRRRGLDKYDPAKTKHGGFEALIFNICSRHMIDLHRSKFGTVARSDVNGNPIKLVSMSEPIGRDEESEKLTIGDLLSSDVDTSVLIMEALESVPDDQISPNYRLSWKELFRMSVEMGPDLIARQVGISESRIYQLQREIFKRFLQDRIPQKNLDKSDPQVATSVAREDFKSPPEADILHDLEPEGNAVRSASLCQQA